MVENEILEVTQFLETIDNSNVRKSVLEQTKSTHKALFARGNIEIGICENLDAEIKDYFKNEKKKNRYYQIISVEDNYNHGFFHHDEEGLKMAKKFLKIKQSNSKNTFKIIEK